MVVVEVRQQGHGRPHVGDLEAGGVHVAVGLLRQVGEGPRAQGGPEELLLEVGALADEQGAGRHLPGVAAHQGHLPGQGRAGGAHQQALLLQQLDVIPQGIQRQIHGTTSFLSLVRHTFRSRFPQRRIDCSARISMASI